ncbi:MAG: hypothetical protein KF773_18030 [Deltaproteobacteria bacterium]|nr:hypothetical protein [Deltaproteobacteria bacterium]
MSTNAPPCATCGQPLRWIAESYGWGCDRCRQFYPAGAAQPQQAWAQQAPGAGGGSNKTLFLAIGGVVLVGGIIAIVLATRGGGGGGGSRDGVIKSAVAALSSGDVDALVDLAPSPKSVAKWEDCGDGKNETADMADALGDMLRASFKKAVKGLKGGKIQLDEIVTEALEPWKDAGCDDDDDDGEGRRKKRQSGVELIAQKGCKKRGCTATVSARAQQVKVKVKVTPDKDGAKPRTQRVTFEMIEVDGGWYLGEIKGLGKSGLDDDDRGDRDDGDDGDGDNEMLEKFGKHADRICACKDTDCITKATESYGKEMSEWAKENAGKAARRPSEADRKRLEDLTKRMTECATKIATDTANAIEPPKPPDPPDNPLKVDLEDEEEDAGPLALAPADMPGECSAYRDAVAKAMSCKKLDAKMKELYRKGWDGFVKTWGMTSGSTRTSIASTCGQLVESMNKSLEYLCK